MDKMDNSILQGDALTVLKTLESNSVDCIITSPPYWALRDYKVDGQIGNEKTIDEYVDKLIAVFDECKRVLKKTGTCWVVLGDTYGGHKGEMRNPGYKDKEHGYQYRRDAQGLKQNFMLEVDGVKEKSLCMIPERFAIAMIDKGWILRNKIIWHKRNCMPSSAKDRFTIDYEYIYFFTKSQKYYFKTQYEPLAQSTLIRDRYTRISYGKDGEYAVDHKHDSKSNGESRIKRCVWTINTKPFSEAHFAVFPEELVKQCLDAGCPSEICVKCKKARTIEEIKNGQLQRRWSTNNKEGSPYNQQSSMQNTYDYELSDCNCSAGFESGLVLDPFIGSGTVGVVALKNDRRFLGIELNPEYVKMAHTRIKPYLEQTKIVQYLEWKVV